MLVGERTNRARVKRVGEIIQADPSVERIGDLLTMQLGPDQVLLNVSIKFRPGMNVEQLESTIGRIKQHIHKQEPMIERIFIEAAAVRAPARALSERAMRKRGAA